MTAKNNTQKKTKKAAKKAVKKKAAKKTKPKIAGDYSSNSKEAASIYQKRWYNKHATIIAEQQAKQAEKERTEFIKQIKQKYKF